ncbi:MAG: hypothetical protein EXS10_08285 [Phycisphaerales bacterium]|nr:hypothetical protein [Phycisphaerales bacterium]
MGPNPANLARVPNLLASRIALGGIQRSSRSLLAVQVQLATGMQFTRPSENAIGASSVTVLDDLIERRTQRGTNLAQADAVLNSLDASLGDLTDILQEARGIGLSQIGVGSDAATRRNQSAVVGSLVQSLSQIANREQRGIHYFGGDSHGAEPFSSMLNGLRYRGEGLGMRADLGLASDVRLTISGEQAFGALSARVEGDRDLDPSMTATTRLSELRGANGVGVRAGTIEVEVNGTSILVDLSQADSVEDVRAAVQTAMQTIDPLATMTIDPATGDRFAITASAGNTVIIRDSSQANAAGDLGIAGTYVGGVTSTGADLDPKLTIMTSLDSLTGVGSPRGTLRIRNGGQVRELDLSQFDTVQDFQNAVTNLNMGVRVEIGADGRRLDIKNELSGARMSIEEVGGGSIATELGIRSMTLSTRLADFDDGRGVRQTTGAVDAITGLPDPAANRDIKVTLKDGRTIEVDIGASLTVGDVISSMLAAANGAGISVADFNVGLNADGNGISITDNTPGAKTIVESINNSGTAESLGIAGDTSTAFLAGTDRATVAVDGAFAHLMALRDALLANDEAGISFATQRLEADLTRSAEARAEVGVRSRRVVDAASRETELSIQDMSLRASIQDLDYADAATQLSALQQQLQAGLAGASRAVNMSLLDFLT